MRNNLNAQQQLYQLCHALKCYVAVKKKKKKGRFFVLMWKDFQITLN